MLFSLLMLATPKIGPPPKVGPLKPEPEPGLEPELPLLEDDPAESGLLSVSGLDEGLRFVFEPFNPVCC